MPLGFLTLRVVYTKLQQFINHSSGSPTSALAPTGASAHVLLLWSGSHGSLHLPVVFGTLVCCGPPLSHGPKKRVVDFSVCSDFLLVRME